MYNSCRKEGIPNVVFVTEQGARVTRQGYTLVVLQGSERIFMYPLEQLQQLVLMGRVEISTALMGTLLARGIDTVFLYRDGRFKGRLSGPTSKNIDVRERQFARRMLESVCLQISKRLVYAKIKNTAHLLQKLHHALWMELRPRINNALKNVTHSRNLDMLRGIEGSFANLYFKHFPRLLKNPMGFTGRKKHPPPDPVNILLSLGYTFLFNTLYGLVEAAGLDPYAGFFHQSRHGHPALVSDLLEPFRAPIVDQMVIALINNGVITPDHFQQGKERWEIHEAALKAFAQKYQQRLFVTLQVKNVNLTTFGLLQRTVWQFQKFLKGESDDFEPYLFR